MFWSADRCFSAPALPAIWLIATEARPANRAERSRLRRDTALSVLARQSTLAASGSEIGHLPSGQPILAGRPDLHLSLATRGGVVAIGLARGPIGVDVEEINHAGEIPLALLHPLERQALRALPKEEQGQAFALVWAAKEAYVKALGTGLFRATESFAVFLEREACFRVCDPERTDELQGVTKLIRNGGQVALVAAAIIL